MGNNKGIFEIYIETTFKGILAKIIYQKGLLFIEIQGMKVKFNLRNINDIISWVENEFDIQINKDKINELINEAKEKMPKTINDIIDMMAGLDLLFINKVEFIENISKGFVSSIINKMMVITLNNGLSLSFNYGDKIENIVVKDKNEIIVSAKVDEAPVHTENYQPDIVKNN